jgi:F-box/leucine-rich repeat protein 2/20
VADGRQSSHPELISCKEDPDRSPTGTSQLAMIVPTSDRRRRASKIKSIKDVVPSALAAFGRSLKQDLPYDGVPIILLCGDRLDLSQWSLVLTDQCLGSIASAHQTSNGDNQLSLELITLNLSGAEKITDVGLKALSSCSSKLQSLCLENAYNISGDGLATITKQCTDLKHLSLSGCMGISGAGFGIIGQNSRELVTLKLSGCRQVSTWAFMKIFGGCDQIKHLDISFCSLVTDEEIKLLADNCSCSLRQIHLRECKQISDVGLSFLSQGCPNLSEINVRRSEMPFRISDVCLLQLGQGCQGLVSLNLRGCEMITDTGLSWMANWSKDLRHIDLSNCTKVTNSGVRYIGEGELSRRCCYLIAVKTVLTMYKFVSLGCKRLKSIVLVNLKRVSNAGIRCLATGCPNLESLNASGLVMLSDGVDRSFGLEGIQALGKSHCSLTMKRLNLHGCSQLSSNSLKAISNFINLETLDLSSCTSITIEASRIGKACRHLSSLSLASCGHCISDAIVESLVTHASALTSVNISFCPRISEQSLKALSTCKKLQTLDLTGCGITDQAILHLCEGHFSPGLQHLYLAQCTNITDVSLSWITDALKQSVEGCVSLETLSLKGTRYVQCLSQSPCGIS